MGLITVFGQRVEKLCFLRGKQLDIVMNVNDFVDSGSSFDTKCGANWN